MAGPFFSFYFALILMHDSFINLLNMYISSICVLTSELIKRNKILSSPEELQFNKLF